MEAGYSQVAPASVLPERRLARSCGYLVVGGALLGYLFSGLVPSVPLPGASAGQTVRCGRPTVRGTTCLRSVKRGKECPFHGVPVGR